MPQMSPYNWLILFLMFNMIMMFFSSYIHFIMIYMMNNNKKLKMNFYNWKW